jgi:hypothetical protein
MRGKANIERERAAAERAAAHLVAAVVAKAPRTLVWDGDTHTPGSFTALIPRLLDVLPGLHLCAFALEESIEGRQAAWLPLLRARPEAGAPSALTFVAVPLPETASDDRNSASVEDKYVHLGLCALEATGAVDVFCTLSPRRRRARRRRCASTPHARRRVDTLRGAGMGGGDTVLLEARAALGAEGTKTRFCVAPARRWKHLTEAPPAAGAPLCMEDSFLGTVPGVVLLEVD